MKKLTNYTFALLLCYLLGLGPSIALAANTGEAGRRTKAAVPEPVRPPVRPALHASKGRAPSPQAPTVGQASTLLPDGRTLVTGGQGAEGPESGVFFVEPGGAQTALGSGLRNARAHHTATLLPDGRVLVVGGVGQNGRVVQDAEIYDPQAQSSEPLTSPWPGAARAHHTATLLTDGRVLVVGGISGGGVAGSAELWDFRSKRATPLSARPNVARQGHKASLLESGAVLIAGGSDGSGNEVTSAELYNPEGGFNFAGGAPPTDPDAPYVSASIPGNNETRVATDALLSLRFSRPMRVETVNAQTVTLNGPRGAVPVKVVPAEAGRLAFVTPLPSLEKGTSYTLSVSDASDGTNAVAPTTVAFTTEGKAEREVLTDEDWVPGAHNFRGNWRSGRLPETPAMSLPPLRAPEGVTAISGQVLTLNGQPLADVTFRVGDISARSDSTGRFLLSPLPAGHHVMVMDGHTASTAARRYGVFKVGVDAVESKTSGLGYTVWMPKLDSANAVRLSSPTASDTVVTSPRIPGLELRLPAGTAIRDMDGAAVTEVSITPIPTDQPPFPLPAGVDVPVYFTVQPGGSAIIPPRAQLVYPNFMGALAGARIDFYNYDPTEKGWYVYGRGTVTADRRQIVPDAGVVLYEFSGAMVANPNNAPPEGPPPCEECQDGDPVDLSTGLFVYETTDLVVRDTLPLVISRTYRPRDTIIRPFGIGATHPYELFIVGNTWPYTYTDLILPDGSRVHYDRISPGTSYGDAVYEHTATPSAFYKTQIRYVGGRWHLTMKDGTVYEFPDAEGAPTPRQAAMVAMSDRYGNRYTLTRDSNSNLTKLTSPNGRYVTFTYDASNRITQAKDNIGRTVGYTYDATGRLWKVTNPGGGVTEHSYDTANRMTTLKDPKGVTYLTNAYDTSGRVIRQTMADGSIYQFAYTIGTNGKVAQTEVTDPRGNVRRAIFNASGYRASDTYAVGKPEQQVFTYERDPATNKLISVTDPLGRKTAYAYDAKGNVAQVTHRAGTSGAVTTAFTYEPTFNQVATVTDPLNHTVTYGYDAGGNVTSVTDPLNHRATLAYNAAGQVTSVTDPLQNSRTFSYEGGDLVAVTDPEGRVTSRFLDDAGRLLSVTDALGRVTKYEYDALDRPTRTTDPAAGTVSFTYDANGNILTVTDARGQVTTFTYDNMDRLASRKDALLKSQTYQYDGSGNLTKFTDRRGKISVFNYDALDRQTFAGFGAVIPNKGTTTYESTLANTYDAAGRLTKISDSLSGDITFAYDNFDRMTSETTPRGVVSYTYDAVGRRASMTVAGQQAITYAYDDANRLTAITRGATAVGFGFDDANRLTALSLPGGVSLGYGYDRKSQVTAISYRKGGVALGDLTYAYDATGRRVGIGGTYARLALPAAAASLSYNANNQLTQKGAAALTYDPAGNLTSDGTNTYTWDSRNQLSSMSGPGLSASFLYDGMGRRYRKTVNSAATDYLYDGVTAVQELSGTTPAANLLTGGLDAVFTRSDSAGTHTLLPDGLGSTLALLDQSGAVESQYTYDPFGATTASGAAGSNPSQYTGRENDGTGLYFNRARYYSPALQRFLSEDPAGFGGGINLYAYVDNDPLNWTDPFGLDKGNPWLDALQFGLDLAGLIPGLGEPFDLINAGISAGRGDYIGASLSLAAAVPIVGMAATAGKGARKAIVIGENMNRVREAARAANASVYRPWKIVPWDEAKALARNEKWIRRKMKQGCEIIDIGIDAARPNRSPFYDMERRMTGGANYPTTPMFWPPSIP